MHSLSFSTKLKKHQDNESSAEISETFRTEKGTTEFAKIRGYISTIKKHDLSVFKALKGLAVAQQILLSSLGAE